MRLIPAILVVLLCIGCGSGGSSTPSPYRGSWVGQAVATSTGEVANVFVSVSDKGRLTGSWEDALGGGALSGSVSNGGTLTLNIADGQGIDPAIQARGVTNIAGSGAWQGNLQVTTEGYNGMSVAFSVTRQ